MNRDIFSEIIKNVYDVRLYRSLCLVCKTFWNECKKIDIQRFAKYAITQDDGLVFRYACVLPNGNKHGYWYNHVKKDQTKIAKYDNNIRKRSLTFHNKMIDPFIIIIEDDIHSLDYTREEITFETQNYELNYSIRSLQMTSIRVSWENNDFRIICVKGIYSHLTISSQKCHQLHHYDKNHRQHKLCKHRCQIYEINLI